MPESRQHEAAKQRIRDIARRKGLEAEEEYEIWAWSEYHNKAICYAADVLIICKGYTQVVEVDGFKGHNSRYKYHREQRRNDDILRAWFNPIRVRRYTLRELQLITDEEIEEDLGIGS